MGAFGSAVRDGSFPYPQNNIRMHADEKDKFLEALDKAS